jgi:hypothetical protein
MSDLTVPESFASQLSDLPHVVHLRNASGKTLGYFVPVADPGDDALDPGLSNDSLRQIEQSNDWFSTQQVLAHLEKLG